MGIFHNVLDALGLVETIDEVPEKPVETAAAKNDSRIVSMNSAQQRPSAPAMKSNVVAMPQPGREKSTAVKKAEENAKPKSY